MELDFIVPLIVAVLVGFLFGMERFYRTREIGLSNFVLLPISAFILMSITSDIAAKGEIARVVVALLTIVGLFGAVVAFKSSSLREGGVTAMSLLVVTVTTILTTIEEYLLAGVIAGLSFTLVCLLPLVERLLRRLPTRTVLTTTIANTDAAEDDLLDIFDELGIKVEYIARERTSKSERTLRVTCRMTPAKQTALSEILVNEKGVLSFAA